LAQVEEIVDHYTCRWEIEVFFRVLKSGRTVEEIQLETAERFTNCLTL
jgi:IS4 transposase